MAAGILAIVGAGTEFMDMKTMFSRRNSFDLGLDLQSAFLFMKFHRAGDLGIRSRSLQFGNTIRRYGRPARSQCPYCQCRDQISVFHRILLLITTLGSPS